MIWLRRECHNTLIKSKKKKKIQEMNKFDDMMAFLKRALRPKAGSSCWARFLVLEARLEQVIAMDVDFILLTRVWCMAELVEADSLHIHQAMPRAMSSRVPRPRRSIPRPRERPVWTACSPWTSGTRRPPSPPTRSAPLLVGHEPS